MPRFVEVTDVATARTVLNIPEINVVDYISAPDDPATHTAGFQAAIDAAIAGDGNEIVIPAGDWYVDGLVIPKDAPLKIRGQNGHLYPFTPTDTVGTRLLRTRDIPVFIAIGGNPPTISGTTITDNNTSLPEIGPFEVVQSLVLEDITIRNDNATATTPLVDLRAVGGARFHRVCLVDTYYVAGLLEMIAVQDSNFISSYFLGGSTAVRIKSGNDPYFACNALWFTACNIESYGVTGLDIGGASVGADVPRHLHFTDHKQESQLSSDAHIVVREGNTVMFSNSYIAHYLTTGPVVDLQSCYGVFGSIGFTQITLSGWQDPSCRVNIDSGVNYVDLDVRLHTGPASTVNVVTQANPSNSTIDVRINGISQKFNGATRPYRWDKTGTVYQQSDATTSCWYSFNRTGFNSWFLGNPSNPSGDQQQMTITAVDPSGNTQDFVRMRSYSHTSGTNPATATYREFNLPGFLSLSNTSLGWINLVDLVSPPAGPAGGYRLYFSGGAPTVDGKPLGVKVSVPSTAASTGIVGQWAADSSYIYVCTATNTWKRAAISTW